MNDLYLVFIVFGAAFMFLVAFVLLAISYTRISQDYEEMSLYDLREHAKPVTDHRCICQQPGCPSYGVAACSHSTCDHEPGDPEGQ